MKLKRISAFLLAAVFAASAVACGDSDESSRKKSKKDTSSAAEVTSSAADSSTAESTADSSDDTQSTEDTPTTTEPEAEPVPAMTVNEYLSSGAWCFDDESLAKLIAADKRDNTGGYIGYGDWGFNTWIGEENGELLVTARKRWYDIAEGTDRIEYDWEEDEVYQDGEEYKINNFSTALHQCSGVLKDGKIILEKTNGNGDMGLSSYNVVFPLTLVRKERIPYEQAAKDAVGNWKITCNEKYFEYTDNNKDTELDGKTITIGEDGTVSGTIPDNMKGQAKFYDGSSVTFAAVVGNGFDMNYVYTENETLMVLISSGTYVLEKID